MSPTTIRRTSGVAFGVVAIVLTVVSTAAFRTVHRTAGANRLVSHTYDVLTAVEGVGTTIVLAETSAQRPDAAAFDRARAEVRSRVDEVAGLTADDPVQQRNVSELRTETTATIELLQGVASRDPSRQLPPADPSGREAAETAAIRTTLQRMRVEEERLMGERIQNAAGADVETRALMNGLIAAAFGVLALSFLYADRRAVQLDQLNASLAKRVRERTADLETAYAGEKQARLGAERLEAEREQLLARVEALIAHAPIGIALFDVDGRYISLNDGGAAPFGLRRDAFIGRLPRELGDWGPRVEALVRQVMESRVPARVEVTGEAAARPGEPAHWIEQYFPVVSARGDVLAIGAIALDVTERRRAEDERIQLLERERQAHAAADAANRSKDMFLARVSHELRTPLTALRGWARMLREGRLGPERVPHAIAAIDRSGEALAILVEDLIDLSRISTGRLELSRRQLDVAALARESLALLEPAAEARRIGIDADIDFRPLIVEGDSTRLRQVVWNLLSNALKFTPADGRVTLRIAPNGERVEIRVADTGQGIAPEFLPHVFEPFSQAERGGHGLGLGLAIVNQLVAAHGGHIAVTSPGPGGGATFIVSLPLARTPEAV